MSLMPFMKIMPDYIKSAQSLNILEKLKSQTPFEKSLRIDKKMCGNKCKCYFKPYIPAKPHKWDNKFFLLCGSSGYFYNFEVYTEKENNPSGRQDKEPHLGASSNIVVRLS
ncbi:unnamed protein product [Lepeophtheirus salmonis]|uniref:(salmon louse) hypothetical protein n=1 Tax=Lepeophtheirus salmonis TaxID=72036 RepID=A0A7R8D5T0_LEPSM|nr:unnamed protein product [Lepeophtheirus salmonis]CAF2982821.1 unnamed protein product [Lepeophtheirus salmonis]